MVDKKETFVRKGTNAAAVGPAEIFTIDFKTEAEKNDNLPHNNLIITNISTVVSLYIFLEEMINVEKPDFVLFPTQTMSVNLEDGVSYNQVFIKNVHGVTDLAANELKFRVSTIKDLPDRI